MNRIEEMLMNLYVVALNGWSEFKESERGDTNFISMLLIIAIVVVLAGLFLTLGKRAMETVSNQVTNFLSSLGN